MRPAKFNIGDRAIAKIGIFRGDVGTIVERQHITKRWFTNRVQYILEFENGQRRMFRASHLKQE